MSDSPREWAFDVASSSDSRVVRVVSLTASATNALSVDVQLQAKRLQNDFIARAGRPRSSWHRAISPSFWPPQEEAALSTTDLYRTVVAYLGATLDDSSIVVGFTRVLEDRDHLVVSSIVVRDDADAALRMAVERALFVASKELSECFARVILERRATAGDGTRHRREIDVWRGQGGASDALRELLKSDGFELEGTAHLRLTKELGPSDAATDVTRPRADGLVIRALDLERDDLVRIYDVHQHAFGDTAPCFAAWKQHYLEQPRLAPELSSIAWDGDVPVATVFLERVVDGEGGDDHEVAATFATHHEMMTTATTKPPVDPTLAFTPDYAARRTKIESTATRAYVCGVATAASHRNRGLAQALLLRSFQAAATSGLQRVVLSTQCVNRSAVRAYERSGMRVTEALDDGHVALKALQL